MSAKHFPLSTLLREPKTVTAVLDTSDVYIERRDGDDFVMRSSERHADELTAVRFLAWVIKTRPVNDIAANLADEDGPLPWVHYLPDEDRRQFAVELLRSLRAAAELDNFTPVGVLLAQWRHSAEVWADPHLAAELIRPVDVVSDERVARP